MFDANLFSVDLNLIDLPRSAPEFARLIEGSYLRLSGWIAERLPRVGTLITATSLSLYGRYVTETLRQTARKWPFILRAALFIAVVGLGFGLIIGTVSPLVTAGLEAIAIPYLVPVCLSAFIVVGILAERSGRI